MSKRDGDEDWAAPQASASVCRCRGATGTNKRDGEHPGGGGTGNGGCDYLSDGENRAAGSADPRLQLHAVYVIFCRVRGE